MDAGKAPPLHRQLAGLRRAAAKDDGIPVGQEASRRDVSPHVDARHEANAGVRHEVDAPLDETLVELHVRNAIHQQAPDAVGALENGDGVTRMVELLGGGEAGGPGPDDGDTLARAGGGNVRADPPLVEGAIRDDALDRLDRDRVVVQTEGARPLARSGTDAARELGEVVRLVEANGRLLPLAAPDEVVPVRNQVVHGAAGGHSPDELPRVAERGPAVHAARTLPAERRLGNRGVPLIPVPDALLRPAGGSGLAAELEESGRLAHRQFPLTRTGFWAFSSNAAMTASSSESPRSRIRDCDSRTRR